MSFCDNRYYYLNKRLLSIRGQWPFQLRLGGNMMLAVATLFILNFSSIQIWGLVAGISNPGISNLSVIIENGSQLRMHSYMIMKLINCVLTNDKIKMLLEDNEETWRMKRADPKKKILQCYVEASRTFTKRLAIVARGMYKLFPTNKTYRIKFLYRIEHVLDVDKYFNLLMLHGCIAAFFAVSVTTAIITAFALCTLHICALFECIRYNVECIRSTDLVLLKPNINDDKTYHDLIVCIKSHKHALKLSDVLSSSYIMACFYHLENVVISFSVSSVELILLDLKLDAIIRINFFNLGQLFHLYCSCIISYFTVLTSLEKEQ